MSEEKTAPNSPEGEEAVLGSILINGDTIDGLKKWIEPKHFFIVRNRWVYESMLSLSDRHEQIDNLSVGMEMRQRGTLDEIGGMAYLTYLMNGTPTHVHAAAYGKVVVESWRRRQFLHYAQQIGEAALDDPNHARVERIMGEARALLDDPTVYGAAPTVDEKIFHVTKLKDLPRPTWLVQGEIPERGVTVLCGKAGTGKTFVVMNYAFTVAQELPVLYVALEGKYGLYSRVQGLCNHHTVKMDDLMLSFWTDPLRLMEKEQVTAFLSYVEHLKPCLIVIDTLSMAMSGGDPNAPRDMQHFTDSVRAIQQAIDGAVLLVHHTRKSDNVFSGAGNIFNNAETFLTLRNEDGQLILEADKAKDAESFRRYMSMISVGIGKNESTQVVLPAEQVTQTQADRLYPNQYKILEALVEYLNGGAMLGDLMDVTEIAGKGSLLRTLSRLKKLGFIQQGLARTPYEITMLGRSKYKLARMGYEDSSGLPLDSPLDSPHRWQHQPKDSTDSPQTPDSGFSARGDRGESVESKLEQRTLIPPRTEYH